MGTELLYLYRRTDKQTCRSYLSLFAILPTRLLIDGLNQIILKTWEFTLWDMISESECPKSMAVLVFTLFLCWGGKGKIPRLKGFHYKWRWEGAVQYDVRTVAFKFNERVRVCRHTNQHPGPFMARAVIRRPVTASAHVGFGSTKWHWEIYFSGYFGFVSSISFLHRSELVNPSIADAMSPQ